MFWQFWPFLAILTIFHHFSPFWTIWNHFGPDSLFATLTVPKSDLITIAKYCQNPLAKLILCIPLHSCQNLPLHSCQNSQTQTQTKLFVSIYFLLFTLSTNPKSDRLSSLWFVSVDDQTNWLIFQIDYIFVHTKLRWCLYIQRFYFYDTSESRCSPFCNSPQTHICVLLKLKFPSDAYLCTFFEAENDFVLSCFANRFSYFCISGI